MPQLPIVQLRQQAPQARYPEVQPSAAAYLGKGLSELGEVMQKLEDGAAATEAKRVAVEIGAEFDGKLQKNVDEIQDYDEFVNRSLADINDVYQSKLGAASPRAQPLIKAAVADNLIKAKAKANHLGRLKLHEKMQSDYIITKDELARQAVIGSDQDKAEVAKSFGALLAVQVASGSIKPDEARKEQIAFRDKVNSDSMNLAASAQPLSFYERYNAGEFSSNDPVAVERALNIAEKSQRAREEKVKRDTAWASREAERMYISKAEKRELDVAELEQVAEFYQWPDDKVDKIKRIQIGLRESDPNKEKLIADALDPINKADPSMGDIDRAARNMLDLGNKVSPDSKEYRTAMDKIRALKRSVRISSEVGANQAERAERKARTDAKRQASQLMNKFEPRLRADRRRQQQADMFDQIESMSPDQARAFVEQKRRDYESKKKDNNQLETDLNELRSLRR